MRRSSVIAALAMLLLVALVGTGCGGGGGGGGGTASSDTSEQKAGGTLDFAQAGEVLTLTPVEATTQEGINVVSQINETLFKLNAQNKVEPWLAENFKSSADGRVLTLQLRKGALFSDGAPLTSEDVAFTLEKAEKSPAYGSILSGIVKIDTPSKATVVITNAKPAPELPAILSQPAFGVVPKNFGGVSEKQFSQHPIGTGPFIFAAWKHGETVTLERNPKYWRSNEPYLDKLVFHNTPDANSRTSQLLGGQLDVVYEPPWSQLESIENNPGFSVGDYPLGFGHYLILNSGSKAFKDPRVREAASLALDREAINQVAFGGRGQLASQFLPPVIPGYDSTLKPVAKDVARAKELVAEAAAGGPAPSFTLLTGTDVTETTIAQIIQHDLEAAGIKVTLQTLEGSAALEEITSGNFDAYVALFYSQVPSPSELLGYYNATEGLYTGTDVTQTTQLAEEAAGEVNESKRLALYAQIEEVINKEQSVLPIAYTPYSFAFSNEVINFSVNAGGVPAFAEASLSR